MPENVQSSGCPPAATSVAGPRGEAVEQIRRIIPPEVIRSVDQHIDALAAALPGQAGHLPEDLRGLLEGRDVRRWVLSDSGFSSRDMWAAVVGCFMERAWLRAPRLMGEYVKSLVPDVALAVRRAARTCHLGWDNLCRAAADGAEPDGLAISIFAPLAMFFLRSLVAGRLAWDCLVEPEFAPSESQPFNWAPFIERPYPTLRQMLTGQKGKGFRPKGFFYSAFARHLESEGWVERGRVLRRKCSKCGRLGERDICAACGGPLKDDVGLWLLSKDHLARCGHHVVQGGRNQVLLTSSAEESTAGHPDRVERDARLGQASEEPQAVLERRRLQACFREAAGRLVKELAAGKKPSLKGLALCEDLAEVEDIDTLLTPSADNPQPLDLLADSLMAGRLDNRTERVRRINQRLSLLAAKLRVPPSTPLSSGHARVCLSRLRRRYADHLKHLVEADRPLSEWVANRLVQGRAGPDEPFGVEGEG
jgi:hypothetical protein